jgi:hypothetical protein
MAQLRDAQTSQFIAQGSAHEMVLLANDIGMAEVLFDDVGAAFNPTEVLKAYNDEMATAKDLLAKKTTGNGEKVSIQSVIDRLDASKANAVSKRRSADLAIADARDRVKRGR